MWYVADVLRLRTDMQTSCTTSETFALIHSFVCYMFCRNFWCDAITVVFRTDSTLRRTKLACQSTSRKENKSVQSVGVFSKHITFTVHTILSHFQQWYRYTYTHKNSCWPNGISACVHVARALISCEAHTKHWHESLIQDFRKQRQQLHLSLLPTTFGAKYCVQDNWASLERCWTLATAHRPPFGEFFFEKRFFIFFDSFSCSEL